MTPKKLFKKQRHCPGQDRVLDFIVQYKMLNDGNSPYLLQIAQALSITRTMVYIHVKHLAERGKLVYDGDHGLIKLVGGQYMPPSFT